MKKIIMIVFGLLYIQILKSQTPQPNGTLSPSQSDSYCPGITNSRNFILSLVNVTNSDVVIKTESGLSVTNSTLASNNKIELTIWFADQNALNAVLPTLHFKRKSDNVDFQDKFEFPKVRLLGQRNIFPISTSNSMTISNIPLCITNVNINFTKIKYLIPGSNANNDQNYFETVDAYEYFLPNNVIPISGLSPIQGWANHYTGNENITVQLVDAFNNATIQVRGISTTCTNVQPTNYNNIYLNRNPISLVGPSTIHCGETDVKTFSITGVTNANCISSFTWQIANKGWKDINGNLITSNITTTAPNLQLISSDDKNNPPSSFSVVVNSNNGSITLNKNVTFLSPAISLQTYAGQFGLNCNEVQVNAQLVNAPVNNFNIMWTTQNGFTINGNASPQYTGTILSASMEKAGTSQGDVIQATLQASCGTFQSTYFSFEGCLEWNDLTVNSYSSAPMVPEPFLANCSTQDQLPWVTEFEWYWFDGNTFTYAGNSPNLSFWSATWPCGTNSLYVRAKGYYGTSELKYVGEYYGYCSGYRMANTKDATIKLYPNPAQNLLNIEYKLSTPKAIVKITDILGNVIYTNVLTNYVKVVGYNKIDISKLKKGNYVLTIIDGKKIYSKVFQKM